MKTSTVKVLRFNTYYRRIRLFHPLTTYQSQNNFLCSNWNIIKLAVFLMNARIAASFNVLAVDK